MEAQQLFHEREYIDRSSATSKALLAQATTGQKLGKGLYQDSSSLFLGTEIKYAFCRLLRESSLWEFVLDVSCHWKCYSAASTTARLCTVSVKVMFMEM